ncbi:MAG: tRNA pseudouridine(38-40) synthase TruA [Pseudorhodoplanes sp.]
MTRYKLIIEYDGAPYRGWQYQADVPSVQGALEDAIEKFDGQRLTIQGAGRTDAGVHALGQVAHCDLRGDHEPGKVRDALNFYLRPQPVAVLAAERVSDDFNARFSARKRHYLYRIVNRRPDLALDLGRAWRVGRPLDIEAMREGAKRLLGHHDFTTFRSTECQSKSPVKTLDQLDIEADGGTVDVFVSARSFLHNQVRSMVGSIVHVGEGKWSPDDVTRILQARDRTLCGQVAPAEGLYLVKVDY